MTPKKPHAGWNATRRKWEAKGINPQTTKRRSYYGDTAEEASNAAWASFGFTEAIEPEGDVARLYGFYANIYLPTVVRRSDSWKAQIGFAMDLYILPEFGNKLLTEITRPECQAFFNRLAAKGREGREPLKASTLHKMKIVFSCIMNLAEDDDMIAKNPVRRVRLAPAEDPEKTALTFKQLGALMRACPDYLFPPVALMASSLNLGEACAVRRSNVVDGVIQVRRQILQPKGGAVDTDKLKTPQRRRDIPLPQWVIDRILSPSSPQSLTSSSVGIWVSANSTGGYMLPNNVHREMEKLVGNDQVPRITPHELRHTLISLMENELEVPTAVVAAIAGKKGRGITADYSHTFRSQMYRAMERYWTETLKHMSAEAEDKSCLQIG